MNLVDIGRGGEGRPRTRPRLGFLGLGRVGLSRLDALLASDVADVVAIADPSEDALGRAASRVPGAARGQSVRDLLEHQLDGVVIATPSGGHVEQSLAALGAGCAVFCQQPLGRNAHEVRRVVSAARTADRLLAIDLPYRHTWGMQRIRDLIRSGDLGRIFAAELVFHSAHGPDPAWYHDSREGGGCVIDLGIDMVDLALWVLGFPGVRRVTSRLYANGDLLLPGDSRVEDYAAAMIELRSGALLTLACSWRLQAGCEAAIGASFFSPRGGAAMRNVEGAFGDFVAERFEGTARITLAEPPDAWTARGITHWAERLAAGAGYDREAGHAIDVAQVLDAIYGREGAFVADATEAAGGGRAFMNEAA